MIATEAQFSGRVFDTVGVAYLRLENIVADDYTTSVRAAMDALFKSSSICIQPGALVGCMQELAIQHLRIQMLHSFL